jgi:hypothetical protein
MPPEVDVRADTNDVAFRLLLSLSELWEGLQRANIDPAVRGLRISNEYLGGYKRICAGTGCESRLIVEWNESSRHLRVLKADAWPTFETLVSRTVAYVREEATKHGISETVDRAFIQACSAPDEPVRRTIVNRVPRPAAAARR